MDIQEKNRIEKKLNRKLNQIKQSLNLNNGLKVKFLPGAVRLNSQSNPLHGEVQGNHILIYDVDEKAAETTMIHEIREYLMFPLLKPYEEVIALQQSTIQRLMYRLREKVVNNNL